MEECKLCGETDVELFECELCGELYCKNCMEAYDHVIQIDHNCCSICANVNYE